MHSRGKRVTGAAAILAGVSLGTMIAGAPAAGAAPGHAPTVRADARGVAKAASGCRWASSSISGASAWGTLCWTGKTLSARSIQVRDSASDGRYAAFRIQFRYYYGYRWQTVTGYILTSKGHTAVWTSPKHNWSYGQGRKVKDFTMQVCKLGSGHRTCDSRWR